MATYLFESETFGFRQILEKNENGEQRDKDENQVILPTNVLESCWRRLCVDERRKEQSGD